MFWCNSVHASEQHVGEAQALHAELPPLVSVMMLFYRGTCLVCPQLACWPSWNSWVACTHVACFLQLPRPRLLKADPGSLDSNAVQRPRWAVGFASIHGNSGWMYPANNVQQPAPGLLPAMHLVAASMQRSSHHASIRRP
jgi:hypothetical protein